MKCSRTEASSGSKGFDELTAIASPLRAPGRRPLPWQNGELPDRKLKGISSSRECPAYLGIPGAGSGRRRPADNSTADDVAASGSASIRGCKGRPHDPGLPGSNRLPRIVYVFGTHTSGSDEDGTWFRPRWRSYALPPPTNKDDMVRGQSVRGDFVIGYGLSYGACPRH